MSTMKDPVRLVLDPGCPESERELLRHGTRIEPPRDAEARVWQALVGATGAAAAGMSTRTTTTTTTTTATKVQAAGLGAVKIVAVLLALAALAGVVVLAAHVAAPAKDARPAASVALVPAARVPPPPTPPTPAAAPVEPSPWPETPRAPRTRPAPSRLGQETTLVMQARQALRGGDAARALRLLAQCRHLFPTGVLAQERERLTIEALAAAGRAAEASARAADFLRKYPDSPHAGEIRALGLDVSRSR